MQTTVRIPDLRRIGFNDDVTAVFGMIGEQPSMVIYSYGIIDPFFYPRVIDQAEVQLKGARSDDSKMNMDIHNRIGFLRVDNYHQAVELLRAFGNHSNDWTLVDPAFHKYANRLECDMKSSEWYHQAYDDLKHAFIVRTPPRMYPRAREETGAIEQCYIYCTVPGYEAIRLASNRTRRSRIYNYFIFIDQLSNQLRAQLKEEKLVERSSSLQDFLGDVKSKKDESKRVENNFKSWRHRAEVLRMGNTVYEVRCTCKDRNDLTEAVGLDDLSVGWMRQLHR
eukprot:GHVS01060307.1.p1 GENE.GHVS01060307.1~~GHVS01060307.1.p1  ORF type:complete len:280 (+),score=-1.30 GHVS01060307.1:2-841(+)